MGIHLAADRARRWARRAAPLVQAVGDALFPPRCAACGAFLPPARRPEASDPRTAALAVELCADCRPGLSPVESPLCTRCGVMFAGGAGGDHPCGSCLLAPPPFRKARAALVYEGTARAVIGRFKYRGRVHLARPLGAVLAGVFARTWEREEAALIVPVPLHRRRLAERGFNQAALLVREMIRQGAAPESAAAEGLLVRSRATPAQAGRRGSERAGNVSGAFAVRRPERLAGRGVLVVDDVVTTGATVGECARVLLESGAAWVDVLAVARVM